MIIEGPKGPGSTSGVGKTDKAKKTGSTSGTSFSEYLSESEDIDAPPAPVNVGGVNLFVALQAAEHFTGQEERRRALNHADDLLSELEDLQTGLLLGTYTVSQLRNLSSRLRQQRALVNDPGLKSLMDDIELRAAVELAKYE